jgi:hypothetical protein
MGNIWNNCQKTRNEVLDDIKTANNITNQKMFIQKTSLSIIFSLEDNGLLKSIKSKNLIKGKVKSYKSNLEKTIHLDLNDFYLFYNSLLDSRSIFYEDKLKQCIRSGKIKDETESGFCPICDENTVDTMLKCYHCFCEKCIKTWLLEKTNSCPLYRLTINVDKNEDLFESQQWEIVTKINKNQYNEEMKDMFYKNLNKIVNNK